MTFKAFLPAKYLFIKTLTVSIEQFQKVNLFKPNTPQRQKRADGKRHKVNRQRPDDDDDDDDDDRNNALTDK